MSETFKGISPNNYSVVEIFEKRVSEYSNFNCIVDGELKLTYFEVNSKANQLARYLKEQGIKKGDRALLILEKSGIVPIVLLSLLKLGVTYAPISKTYPAERTNNILSKAGFALILTNCYVSNLDISLSTINVEEVLNGIDIAKFSEKNLNIKTAPEDCIAMTFTSGSTGEPKGVCYSNRSVVNAAVNATGEAYFGGVNKSESQNIIWFSDIVWVLHFMDMFGILLNGRTCYIPPVDIKLDDERLSEWILEQKIFASFISPSLLREDFIIPLPRLLSGSEVISNQKIVDNYKSHNRDFRIIYGSSETTGLCTLFEPKEGDNCATIGHDLPNCKTYIVDDNLNEVFDGAIGEICVAGSSIVLGYFENPKLTAEKFLPNPFQTTRDKELGINSVLFKTGDTARRLESGDLLYMGRKDFQLQINGIRIEPSDIEKWMKEYSLITDAIVLNKTHKYDNSQYLVGYYTSDEEILPDSLTHFLQEKLPEYMVPNLFMRLEAFPRTLNGKVNRPQFPDPKITRTDKITPATTITQRRLLMIWSNLLGIDTSEISINDKFNNLGGTSISMVHLSHIIHRDLNQILTPGEIVKYNTISKQAQYLESNNQGNNLLVNLNGGQENELAICLVHPALGDATLAYSKLSNLINPEKVTLYGINNYFEKYPTTDPIDSNELTSHYIDQIREVLEKYDSVILGGWSFGGKMAFNMAIQLERVGIEIDDVYIFDSSISDNPDTEEYQNIAGRDKGYILAAHIEKTMKQSLVDFGKSGLVDHFKNILDLMYYVSSDIDRKLPYFGGKITLFRAMDDKDKNDSYTNGFDALCDNIEVIELPCTHGNIINNCSEAIVAVIGI